MLNKTYSFSRDVYIIDGLRTPFLKARGKPGPFSASDLAVQAGRPLLLRQPFSPTELDEVIMGCVMPSEDEANIARIIALRLKCGNKMPAWTVQRNCASGMQAIDAAAQAISSGRANLILAGGTEAMSRTPLLFNKQLTTWLTHWKMAPSLSDRLKSLLKLKPHFFKPTIALLRGLSDPLIGLNMGQTAEILAYQFHISRTQMDAFALQSHRRACYSQTQLSEEITPIYDAAGKCYEVDDGIRSDSTLESLAKLNPFFDKPYGLVTAGNSSQITDGAALVILASEAAVQQYRLPILGRLVDVAWAALDPREMGLGPVFSTTPLLQRNNLNKADIDYWEINEAFSAQVLACLTAWEDENFCQQSLGLASALGTLDPARLNINGGAIALGHPVGASGARIILHLLHVLKRDHEKEQHRKQRGVATLCVGGGQGGAMLVESI